MRGTSLVLAGALLTAGATIVRADDLTGQQRFLCTASQVTLCYSDGDCDKGSAWDFDVPQFIEVDLPAKRLSTTKASGQSRTTPITNLQREAGQVVLQGYENKRAFSFLIDEKTGWMTVAVARRDIAVTVFGACTPKTAGE
ncbi:MAG TPA: hypothetical protein VFV75_11390 [Candidatus Polarisedimenticolaceae bacterium]|nr:hypothetical protein [Candidatus Polarisedimenticolaceae bacterium]